MSEIRYCSKFISQDLKNKMVFIGGPRQVGKTTLSKQICESSQEEWEYYNWDIDIDIDRTAIRNKTWREDSRWKNWIKGVYDSKSEKQNFIVTGSARLDVYKQGGDSLIGRYHYWRLHPFTLDELPNNINKQDAYGRLLKLGGFPEPFLMNDEREARRWRRERFLRILREDIRDLENIKHLDILTFFLEALRHRVSSMITLSNIARDLEISPNTAKAWLSLLKRMYLCFSISAYTSKISRAISKPPKVYFYDNGDVIETETPGSRLENLVATHLLKHLNFIEDYHGYECKLHYIRDKDGREVDFAIVIENKLVELIEVKLSDTALSSSLKYYRNKLKPTKTTQIVGTLERSFHKDGVLVTNPIEYFCNPPWEFE